MRYNHARNCSASPPATRETPYKPHERKREQKHRQRCLQQLDTKRHTVGYRKCKPLLNFVEPNWTYRPWKAYDKTYGTDF